MRLPLWIKYRRRHCRSCGAREALRYGWRVVLCERCRRRVSLILGAVVDHAAR